jgi:hypothetical protein
MPYARSVQFARGLRPWSYYFEFFNVIMDSTQCCQVALKGVSTRATIRHNLPTSTWITRNNIQLQLYRKLLSSALRFNWRFIKSSSYGVLKDAWL